MGNTETYRSATPSKAITSLDESQARLPLAVASDVIPRALTIAGSDPTGGAGIQADLKTFAAHGVFGLSAITAVTSQDTHGVQAIFPIPPATVRSQLETLLRDVSVSAVKIGMIYLAETVRALADIVAEFNLTVVLDTPFIAKGGTPLVEAAAIPLLRERLLPLASVVTPNIPEASALTGIAIENREDMLHAAEALERSCRGTILLKGAHLYDGHTGDLLWQQGDYEWLEAPFVATRNTHGTGCTLSAAIAANLALGAEIAASARRAKAYVTEALRASITLGSGHGSLGHFSTSLSASSLLGHKHEIPEGSVSHRSADAQERSVAITE